MAAQLSRVQPQVNAALNVADSYTATPDSGSRLYAQQVIDSGLDIDGQIIAVGLGNPTWSHRVEFQGSASVAHLANLPAHTGPIDAVLVGGKVATPAPLDQIESERDLVAQGITTVTPHYNADGTVLAHNGSSNATVKYCIYTRGSVLQAPDEYEPTIIRGVLSIVGSPEGEDPALQQAYAQQYHADLQMIATGQMPPPFQAIQR
jgi:hypothetical protein